MLTLNAPAAEAARRAGVRAATDVTGFGLLGHALNLARESRLTLELHPRELPLLPGAREHAERFQARGLKANRQHFEPQVEWRSRPEPALEALLFDPQTSGGLLLLVPEAALDRLLADLGEARVIGRAREEGARPLVVA
jgi:selenide,water dikinase